MCIVCGIHGDRGCSYKYTGPCTLRLGAESTLSVIREIGSAIVHILGASVSSKRTVRKEEVDRRDDFFIGPRSPGHSISQWCTPLAPYHII